MMKFIRGKSASNPPTPSKRDHQDKRNSVDLQNKPCALAYDPKLNLLAIGNRNGTIKIYGKRGLELQASFDVLDRPHRICQLVFIEGTGKLICLCEDSSLHLWEICCYPAFSTHSRLPSTSSSQLKKNSSQSASSSISSSPSPSSSPLPSALPSESFSHPDSCKTSSSQPPVSPLRRLIRTKVCNFFSRPISCTSPVNRIDSPLNDQLSKSESHDSAISITSSSDDCKEDQNETLKSLPIKTEDDQVQPKPNQIHHQSSRLSEHDAKSSSSSQSNVNTDEAIVVQKVSTTSPSDQISLPTVSNVKTSSSTLSSQTDIQSCDSPQPQSLPLELQRRLCSWSNEIVSFTLNSNSNYATIVTRMGELFMLDVQRFELMPQHTTAFNQHQWQLNQLQQRLQQQSIQQRQHSQKNAFNRQHLLPPKKKLHLLAQQTRFSSSEMNLNSSCNDSVISCSNSSVSTLSSSTNSSDEASVNELELLPSLDQVDHHESHRMPRQFSNIHHHHHHHREHSIISQPSKSKQFMVKVYTSILCSEVEYKTLSITNETTSKQLICLLLSKFKMRHRDPNLFYLTMEITLKKSGMALKNVMVLNDESCPIQLKSCYPHEDTKFCLMMKSGGLVKVYDSCLMSGSLYKSVLLSESTTVRELIQLILHCYNCNERPEDFCLFEVSKTKSVLVPELDLPLKRQSQWADRDNCLFQLRRTKDELGMKKKVPIKKLQASFIATNTTTTTTTIITTPVTSINNNNNNKAYCDHQNYFYI